MPSAYQNLTSVFSRVHHLDHAMTFLGWDQMVMMPTNGIESRARSMAELAGIRHDILSDSQLETWFTEAADEVTDNWQKTSLKEMLRVWRQTVCLPSELVSQKIIAGAKCEHGWRTQKGDDDWQGFLQNFTEVVTLSRVEARHRQEAAGNQFSVPYDALLDLHCSGDTSAMIDSIFQQLKAEIPGLLTRVMDAQSHSPAIDLNGHYPIDLQKKLSEELMSILGFDFESGRLDVSAHPFSTGGHGDQRITTRYRDNEFADALQATAHEMGHASYEGGLPDDWLELPVGSSRNMCIHESQSLLFEKQIFLSKAFCQHFTQAIHRYLPETTSVSHDQLWRSCTRVRPSFIRVEADEVTYPLHVMLRYDIESTLINGELEATDIPTIWEQKMKDYLGLDVGGRHSLGCLQDIHWTDGAFGYFPSYTMGAVNGAQLFATIKVQHPDWQERFAAGDTEFVRTWLSENIWRQASLHESQEIMSRATGEGSRARYLLEHLEARYVGGEY